MVLLTLVPRGDKLLAEVNVRNEDVASVKKGQQVKLKLAAYPFLKHGLLDGSVLHVAADARAASGAHQSKDEAEFGNAGYRVLVDLQQPRPRSNDGTSISRLEAGMAVTAEVQLGSRTVIEYLLSPIVRTANEAGRER